MAIDTKILGEELTNYVDIPYDGFEIGNPPIVTGYEAIKNSLKLFIFSNPGDYGRNIIKGGPTLQFLGLPLNESSKTRIQEILKNSLQVYENIVVQSINVIPDPIKKSWKISIVFSDMYNKLLGDIHFSVFTS